MSKLVTYGYACLLILSSPDVVAQGTFQSVVVPGNLVNVDGNSLQEVPFGQLDPSTRYQQVFNASDFATLPEGGGIIRSIAFRADGPRNSPSGVTIPRFHISISTTSRSADSLSPVFSENVGADVMVIHNGNNESYLSVADPNRNPENFSLAFVNLEFFYDPAEGNLLIDFRNFLGTARGSVLLDAQDVVGDSISSIFSANVNSSTAEFIQTQGLVTEFVITPVPEPSAMAIAAAGLGIVAMYHRRKTV